jgi:hypothetical protein
VRLVTLVQPEQPATLDRLELPAPPVLIQAILAQQVRPVLTRAILAHLVRPVLTRAILVRLVQPAIIITTTMVRAATLVRLDRAILAHLVRPVPIRAILVRLVQPVRPARQIRKIQRIRPARMTPVIRVTHTGLVSATRAMCARTRCSAPGMASSCTECAGLVVLINRAASMPGPRSIVASRPNSTMSAVDAVSIGHRVPIRATACGINLSLPATATLAGWTNTASRTITTRCRRIISADAVISEVTNPDRGSSLRLVGERVRLFEFIVT